MARSAAVIRFILFCTFFFFGASAITLSILAEEVQTFIKNKELVQETEAANEKIKDLIVDYEAQIKQIKSDPNLLEKLKRVALGQEPESEDTVYPIASDDLLEKVNAVLKETQQEEKPSLAIKWIHRCAEPNNRRVLFFAGSGLILITFIFFGTPSQVKKKKVLEKHTDSISQEPED